MKRLDLLADSGYCATICGGTESEFLRLIVHGGGENLGTCGVQCANAGIYTGGNNSVIDGVDIYDVALEGIQIYNGGGGIPTGNIIRNSRIHDLRTADPVPGRISGILIGGNNNLVYNNVCYDVGFWDGNSGRRDQPRLFASSRVACAQRRHVRRAGRDGCEWHPASPGVGV